MDIAKKLDLLRNEMQQKNIDIYIIPSTDAHNSEYLPECLNRRTWISNFNGSAGEVMVTTDHAYLSTDGRYFLQAIQQLDAQHYTLIKQTGFGSEIENWLLLHAKGKRLGIDPEQISITRGHHLQHIMQQLGGELVPLKDNLIDQCRIKSGENLTLPSSNAFCLTETYTGKSTTNKLHWLKEILAKKHVDYLALNVLDEIAWLFNIRGNDIDYNPLVISYAIVGINQTLLFIDKEKLSKDTQNTLIGSGITLLNYDLFTTSLANLNGSIWLDAHTANYAMLQNTAANTTIIDATSPIVLAKACKNTVEANGARTAHIKDAVAVINFLYWLDNNWQHGIDEIVAAQTLADFRAQQINIMGASFTTVSGFASNSAIIHYRVTPKTSKVINDSNMYLVDSGGQYLEGTTDITRTIHLGRPTVEQKKHYTLVLKGHLALGRAKFPHGTCGEHLDVLARSALWDEYLNYRHGTGHGVGSFLCVHEGPQKISSAISNTPLLPGMIVSNEPGLYIDGAYGIRIENLCLVTKTDNPKAQSSEYGPFYQFEDLTLIPYCNKLIELDLLSQTEKNQLKTYYTRIKDTVYPLLKKDEQQWLLQQLDIFNN